MSNHTLGPWKAEGWEGVVVNDSNGNTLCLMPGANYGLDIVKANAHLIAAAPDLLAACEAIVEYAPPNLGIESNTVRKTMAGEALARARAAIAKARGENGGVK